MKLNLSLLSAAAMFNAATAAATVNNGLRGLTSTDASRRLGMATSEEITQLDVCYASVDANAKALATPLTFNDFGGKILGPGSYKADAAMLLTATLYLSDYLIDSDGAHVQIANPEWYFYLGGALTTAVNSKIVFVGDYTDGDPTTYENNVVYDPSDSTPPGANFLTHSLANSLYWKVTGAVTIGVASFMSGDVRAIGAITVGADSFCGDLDAGGALILGPGTFSGSLKATGALNVDVDANQGVDPPVDIYDPTQVVYEGGLEQELIDCNASL